ncbi:MAG: beta-propeller fold lactonase family protein, partial [bacterium]|nr:beta-propeller fold lactonase family protein [bacterium]
MFGRVTSSGTVLALATLLLMGGDPDLASAPGAAASGQPLYRSPNHICLSADGSVGYVVNQTSNSISIIDVAARRVVGEIPAEAYPASCAISADDRRLYVTNLHRGSVDIVDLDRRRVVRTLATGQEPYGVKASADGRRLYVANALSNTVSIFNTGSGELLVETPVGRSPRYL